MDSMDALPGPHQPRRALVADDGMGLGLLLALVLEELGFLPEVVSDGAAAAALLAARPRDLALAILDPAAPGLRLEALDPALPVVLLRERGAPPAIAGRAAWLGRPLSRADLVDALISAGALPLPARAHFG